MSTVTDFAPHGTLTFTQALARAEVLARTALPPEAHGRIEMAMALARQGSVLQLDSGEWEVASQTTPGTIYHVNGFCSCDDAHYRGAMCKHRLSVYLTRRAMQLMAGPVETVLPLDETAEAQEPPAPVVPLVPVPPAEPATVPAAPALPEARCSMNVHVTIAGRQVQVTLRGHDELEVLTRLEALLERYPVPAQGQPSQAPDATPQCPQHGAMKPSTKGTGWYCPHKLDDGTWCPHKGT